MLKDLMKLKNQIDEMIETYKDLHPDEEESQKEEALKKIREGSYENKLSKSKRTEITGQSQGQSTLCVYGDT